MGKVEAARELAEQVLSKNLSKSEFLSLKKKVSGKHGLANVVRNSDVSVVLKQEHGTQLVFLKTRKTRSRSGVCPVAIMSRPWHCPHGTCTFCPGGPEFGSPQSYTGFEPSAMRGKQNEFDAYKQVSVRLRQYEAIGHHPSKCEFIVQGGTFNFQPRPYQELFVKRAFDAFNGFDSNSVYEAIKANEGVEHRVVGVTFETKPDWANRSEVEWLLGLGATRIELGVQSLSDSVLERVNRGHGVAETVEATRECKDAFLKVCYHWMPGLYCTPGEDLEMFKQVFSDPNFRPDMLKIYPTLVMPGTEMFEEWKRGEFVPYDDNTAARVIAEMKSIVPEYVRIMRVDRDIPSQLIAAGVKKSNIRELARDEMVKQGWKCECIRCREAAFKKINWSAVELKRIEYEASGGREVFLSFEDDNDALIGFVRVRKNAVGKVGVRELRVFGEQIPVGEEGYAVQHKGFGQKLMVHAEETANDWNAEKLYVLAGTGVKPYYRRLGFVDEGVYLAKALR